MTKKIAILITLLIFSYACTNNQLDDKSIKIDKLSDLMDYERDAKIKIFINKKPVVYDYNHISKTPWQIVIDEILYIHGIKNGLDKKHEGKDYKPKYIKRLVIDELRQNYREEIPHHFEVSEKEKKDYYKKHIDKYTSLKYYQATVDGDKDYAERIRKELESSNRIKELKEKYENSEKVEFKFIGRKNKPLKDVTFNEISPGQVSEPIKLEENKYKIVKIGNKIIVPYDKIHRYIEITVSKLKVAQAFEKKVQELKEKDNIEVRILEES